MNKIFSLGPAVFLFIVYLILSRLGNLNLIAYIILMLSFAAAILLYKEKWYGAVFGVLIGITYIYSYYQNNSPKLDERPLAIAIIIYYLILGIFVKKNANRR